MRVALVCSSGGHLTQLHRLQPWWRTHERLWVTFDTLDAVSLLEGERVIWAHHPTTRSLLRAVLNLALAWWTLRRERPDVVVSNGAAVAVPFFLVAKILAIPTVYVEVVDRLDTRTLTGRLVYPLADVFCAQWEEQVHLYPKAEHIGTLL